MASEPYDIQYVVEQIGQVLGRHYSLVEFDSLTPLQHLQLVADLFNHLAPTTFKVEFTAETQHQVSGQCAQFLLRILNYRVPPLYHQTFSASFSQGEKATLFPIFQWVLQRMPENRKRVYLSRFLTRIDVPEDLRTQDDMVRELYTHYEQLREEFIQTHRRLDQLKETHADPKEIRQRITTGEQERDQLNMYIVSKEKSMTSLPNKEALLSTARNLRFEEEESRRVSERLEDQQLAVDAAKRRVAELTNRLRDVRRDISEGRVDVVLQRLTDDIRAHKMQLSQGLPEEINEKRQQVAELQKLVSEQLDIPSLQAQAVELDRSLGVLQAQMAERQRPAEDGMSLAVMKQQVDRVVNRKQEVMNQLSSIQTENQRLNEELREKHVQIEQLRNRKMPRGEDFKTLATEARRKTAATKEMKSKLQDLRGEWGVLQYTEKLLRLKHEDLQEELSKLEVNFGARGYVQTAEQLQKLADDKTAVEQDKGKTLEELSVMVQNLVSAIYEQRTKIAPQIVELRNVRTAAQSTDQEYDEKKAAFDYQEGIMMQDISKLDHERQTLAEETQQHETFFHRFHCQRAVTQSLLARAHDEDQFRSGERSLGKGVNSHTQLFQTSAESLEARTKEMRKRRRDIEEHQDTNLQQVEWFSSLRKILECKLQGLRRAAAESMGAVTTVDQDIQALGVGGGQRLGVDMLVLTPS